MMNKKTQRIVGAIIAVLVTISMVGAGMFGYFTSAAVPAVQNSSSSPDSALADNYQKAKDKVADLSRQTEANASDVELQQNLGDAYFELALAAQQIAPDEIKADFNQAVKSYQAVLATRQDISILTDLATAAFYGGQYDLADQTFREALALQPDFEQALFYYGVFLSEVKQDYAAAIELWQKAVDNNPTGPNADWLKQYIAQTKSRQEALQQSPAIPDTAADTAAAQP
ncbi:MAG TPA: tetratricopeptide repeat protein [Desulfitobacteriaceae bacterium]|nr:tetratricopeptide repeat protein [Desulfitobacteriaceae bacterium]